MVLAQALQMPGVMASAVVTASACRVPQTQAIESDDSNRVSVEQNKCERDSNKSSIKKVDHTNAINQRNVENTQNRNDDSDNLLYSPKHTKLKYKELDRKGGMREIAYENVKGIDQDPDFTWSRERNIESKAMNGRRRVLAERAEKVEENAINV